jgi:hypothetical protein
MEACEPCGSNSTEKDVDTLLDFRVNVQNLQREERCFGKLQGAYVILVVETCLIWGSLLCGIWYLLAVLQGKGVGACELRASMIG